MEKQLIEAKLWAPEQGPSPAQSIIGAWTLLARLGAVGRFVGRAQDGQYEYLIATPGGGEMLASGRGESIPAAICAAVLVARNRLEEAKHQGQPTPNRQGEEPTRKLGIQGST